MSTDSFGALIIAVSEGQSCWTQCSSVLHNHPSLQTTGCHRRWL